MDVAIFGDRKSRVPADWTSETVVSVLSDVDLDATAGLAEGATLTFVGVIGDLRVRVPPGTRVHVAGFRLLGDRRVDVSPGDGPTLRVNAHSLLGDLVVTDSDR